MTCRAACRRCHAQAGIDGSGQIIGIGDSGVEVDSCYFFDPQVPLVPTGTMTFPGTTARAVFQSSQHRCAEQERP